MSIDNINLSYGILPANSPGQWIEATAVIRDESIDVFIATLCRRSETGEFFQYEVSQDVSQPLTAELVLSLLAIVAEPPFEPTNRLLRILSSCQSKLVRREVSRMLESKIQSKIHEYEAPTFVAQKLGEHLARRNKYRKFNN
jgi:hypothetical protein